MSKSSRFERHRCTRVMLVQAFYQFLLCNQDISFVIKEFTNFRLGLTQDYPHLADPGFFLGIMNVYQSHPLTIKNFMQSILQEGWILERMDLVTQAILMAGTCEFLWTERKTPAPVIISEYIDIAKGFLAHNEYLFINKSLDHIAKNLGIPLIKD